MKTIFKSALVALTALAAGFASCQKENGGNTKKDGKSVVVAFSHEEMANASRAVGDSEGTQAVTLTGDARVYFTTVTGEIMDYLTVKCSTPMTAYDADNRVVGLNYVNVAQTPGGQLVEGLPASVSKVVIIANASTYYTSGNVSQHSATVASMADFDAIPLAGESNLVPAGGTNSETDAIIYNANVTIAPIGARIEIVEIAADATGSTIESFTLKGIYANNFYPTMSMYGGNPGTIVNGSTVNGNYAGGTAPYTSANLYDNPVNAKEATTYNAGTGKVWGYNLLAPTTADAEMVHIVIHLADVVIATNDAVTYAGDQYLTIRNFYVNGSTKLDKLEKGYIYKITKISFAESDLTGTPELFLIDVHVKATLKGWTATTVTTDFE